MNEKDNLEYSSEAYLMKRKSLTDETEQIREGKIEKIGTYRNARYRKL